MTEAQVDILASYTSGFVGADLAALHRHALLRALDRRAERVDKSNGQISESEMMSWEDAHSALSVVRPSALREVELQVPKTRWDDIGGQVHRCT